MVGVIATKYGEGKGGWSTKVCRRVHGCGLWRSINERWEIFSKHMAFVVGDGTLTRFGMIGGLEIIHSLSSILSYTSVLIIRKLVFLSFWVIR